MDVPLVRVEVLVPLVRVEVLLVRLEFPLSRFTVVVRPVLSVVFTVVRVVPLLLTRVLIVVPGVGVFVVLVFVVVAVVVPLARVEVLGLSLVRLLLFSTSVRS